MISTPTRRPRTPNAANSGSAILSDILERASLQYDAMISTPTSRRPRSPNAANNGAAILRDILEHVSLLKLLGFMFALFSLAMVATLIAMPDYEPHINFIRNRHAGSGGGASAGTDSRYLGTSALTRRSIRGLPNDSSDRQRDANGNVMDLLTIRYTPAVFPIVVPPSTWPVPRIDLNDGHRTYPSQSSEYEYIIHPGDDDYKMTVPRFWTRPLHNQSLMERDLAMKIGTCTSPGEGGNHGGRGKGCPPDERTIFVALASYRDYQCRETLDSIFARAKHPERIRVAVVDQRDPEDVSCVVPIKPCNRDGNQAVCKHGNQIETYEMDRNYAVGPTFARHIAYRYYRGEYYAMQVDAQTTFVQDWDENIISQHEATGNEMAVLSHLPMDIAGSIDAKTGRALEMERTVMCETHYISDNYLENELWILKEDVSRERGPILQPFWSAAFSFARGHFAINVPYDQYMSFLFSEEEISIALRGFSVGYDYYAPSSNVCFHTYAKGENEKVRKAVPLFWENEEKYGDDVDNARTRVKCMIGLSPEKNVHVWNHVGRELYGLGGARKVTKFFELYGIDPLNKVHEHNLCDFVDNGMMHDMFRQHLRANGMGIDYGLIDYRFKDPRRNNSHNSVNEEKFGSEVEDEQRNGEASPSKPVEDTADKDKDEQVDKAATEEAEADKPKDEAANVEGINVAEEADAGDNAEKKEIDAKVEDEQKNDEESPLKPGEDTADKDKDEQVDKAATEEAESDKPKDEAANVEEISVAAEAEADKHAEKKEIDAKVEDEQKNDEESPLKPGEDTADKDKDEQVDKAATEDQPKDEAANVEGINVAAEADAGENAEKKEIDAKVEDEQKNDEESPLKPGEDNVDKNKDEQGDKAATTSVAV